MHTNRENENSEHSGKGYEVRDVNTPKLIGMSVAIMIVIIVIIVALNEVFTMTKERIIFEQFLKPQSSMLARQRAHEDSVLANFGVVNADSQAYRMPIKDAMQLVAGGGAR